MMIINDDDDDAANDVRDEHHQPRLELRHVVRDPDAGLERLRGGTHLGRVPLRAVDRAQVSRQSPQVALLGRSRQGGGIQPPRLAAHLLRA